MVPLLILPGWRRRAWGRKLPVVAVAVALLSWGCFAYMLPLPGAWTGVNTGLAPAGLPERLSPEALVAFGFAAAVGFACCPYLDATFLRARASTDVATGRAAFTLGFLGVFLSMIVGSLLYAGLLIPAFAGEEVELSPVWRIVLGVHLLVQIAFTLACHLRERGELDPQGRHLLVPAVLLLFALAAVLLAGVRLGALASVERPAGPTVGEAAYRFFLLAYGMVFPAYVWLCVLRRGELTRPLIVPLRGHLRGRGGAGHRRVRRRPVAVADRRGGGGGGGEGGAGRAGKERKRRGEKVRKSATRRARRPARGAPA